MVLINRIATNLETPKGYQPSGVLTVRAFGIATVKLPYHFLRNSVIKDTVR
jgi:hypothetical protein